MREERCALTWHVSIEQVIGLLLAVLLMAVGVLGSLLPGIPSTPLVLAAAMVHRLYFGEHGASFWILGLLLGWTILSLLLDYLASVWVAKKFGASRRGIIGALVGGVIGICFSFPGILFGPFLGALVGELTGGRKFKEAAYAGFGALLGLAAGSIGKLLSSIGMLLVFVVNVLWRS